MIPDASVKIRSAAALLVPVPASAKALYGYLEGDIRRHLRNEHRAPLNAIMIALRAEASPGAPTWLPHDIAAVKRQLNDLADLVGEHEAVPMTRAELARRLEQAKAEGYRMAQEEGRQGGKRSRREAVEEMQSEALRCVSQQ
jgi:hypothetical protein